MALITGFEGFQSDVYTDQAGHKSIGYGHLIRPGESFDTPMTKFAATGLMRKDLQGAQAMVDRYISVTLNDNQYGALTSLVYNVGISPLTGPLAQHVNDFDFAGAAEHFLLFNKVHSDDGFIVSDGLDRRRHAEHDLFLTPPTI
jgi:lysozyme